MRLTELSSAWKRAKHFGIHYDGPFCCLHSAIGNNYARILDAEEPNTVDELLMFHFWAEGLNRLADSCKVADRLDLREAFSSFRSMLWLDPTVLQVGVP